MGKVGVRPDVVEYVSQTHTMLALVSSGIGAINGHDVQSATGLVAGGSLGSPAQPSLLAKFLQRLVLHTVLDIGTVLRINRRTFMPSSYRQHYQPKPDRTPAWLRRIWVWF